MVEIQALRNKIIIEPLTLEPQKYGSIILTSVAEPTISSDRGTVVSVGTGSVMADGSRYPFDVKIGDVVMFLPTFVETKINGKLYYTMEENNILGICNE